METERMVGRFDAVEFVRSPIDPRDDLRDWVSALRSRGFTEDLLRDVHGFSDSDSIRSTSAAIRSHVRDAVALLDQAHIRRPQDRHGQ